MLLHDLNHPNDRQESGYSDLAGLAGSESGAADPASDRLHRYWQRTRRLTGQLLLVWAGISFGLTYFARELNFTFFGWPFSFWVASEGAMIVFCILVAYYARAMRKLDELYRP